MATPLKIGLIGLDSSHCVAFTQILQDVSFKYHLPGAQITGIYPGGSPAFSLSRDRVQGFTEQLHNQYGLPIYDNLEHLAADVDAMLLLSSDGRQHLEQFQHLSCGKPVFIDKPLATTTAEAAEILHLSAQTGTPILSCSSLRFAAGIAGSLESGDELISCESFGPASILPDYPGLFWYGVHGIDILFSWMKAGCRQVRCISHPKMDVIVGEWNDGRLGIFRGTRFGVNSFGCLLNTNRGMVLRLAQDEPPYYYLLLKTVLEFFSHGIQKVPHQEMYEVIAFIEAAHESAHNGGQAVNTKAFELAML